MLKLQKSYFYWFSFLSVLLFSFFLFSINTSYPTNSSSDELYYLNGSESIDPLANPHTSNLPLEIRKAPIEPKASKTNAVAVETNATVYPTNFSAFDFFLDTENGKNYPADKILTQQYNDLQKTFQSRQINTATYYVSPDGSDYNDGSEARPWQTLGYAFSQLHSGNTLLIKGGTYYPARTLYAGSKLANPTSEESRIIIRPYKNEKVIIDGTQIAYRNSGRDWGGIINVDHCDYITIEGLTLQNSPVQGIFVNKKNVHIRNNHIIHTGGSAIFTTRSGHIIEGNHCEKNEYLGNNEVIALYNTKDSIVRYNYIHHTGNENNHKDGIAIDIKDGGNNILVYGNHIHHVGVVGIYVDARGPVHNIKIYDNYLHDSVGHGIVLSSEPEADQKDVVLKNVTLYNNIVYNFDRGIVLGWTNTPLNPLQDISVVNNLSYKNSRHGIVLGTTPIDRADLQHAKNIKIYNNIFAKNGEEQIDKFPGKIYFEEYTIENNLILGKTDVVGKSHLKEVPKSLNNLSLERSRILK